MYLGYVYDEIEAGLGALADEVVVLGFLSLNTRVFLLVRQT
jgi:hypothetical protein